jgi:hypothetical protein
LGVPFSSVSLSRGTIVTTAPCAPEAFWQSRQWQARSSVGELLRL